MKRGVFRPVVEVDDTNTWYKLAAINLISSSHIENPNNIVITAYLLIVRSEEDKALVDNYIKKTRVYEDVNIGDRLYECPYRIIVANFIERNTIRETTRCIIRTKEKDIPVDHLTVDFSYSGSISENFSITKSDENQKLLATPKLS